MGNIEDKDANCNDYPGDFQEGRKLLECKFILHGTNVVNGDIERSRNQTGRDHGCEKNCNDYDGAPEDFVAGGYDYRKDCTGEKFEIPDAILSENQRTHRKT